MNSFPEIFAIIYFGIGLIILGIVLGIARIYELYLDNRKLNRDNNMDICNCGTDCYTCDPVGDNDWK